MCEKCLLESQIQLTHAEAIEKLANASATLFYSNPAASAAVADYIAESFSITVPERRSAESSEPAPAAGQTGTANTAEQVNVAGRSANSPLSGDQDEVDMPPALRALADYLSGLGAEVRVTRFPL